MHDLKGAEMNHRDHQRIARAAWAYLCQPGLELHELVTAEGPAAAWAQLRERPARPAGLRDELATIEAGRLPGLAQQAATLAVRAGQVLIPEDEQWPPQLADLATTAPAAHRPPPLLCLFLAGAAPLGRLLASSLTITGARAATDYGIHVARSLAHDCANHGWTVVAGGAYGIDASAHRGALAAGAPTIAVLPGGLHRPHPAAHTHLFETITASGLLASMFAPGTPPTRHRMYLTRQLLAVLTGGTVVVEASIRSGALHTLSCAATLGKPAMVVPGPITSACSAGCHQALRGDPRTRPVTTADEIITELTAAGHTPPAPPQP
jgi:DNA processing protein